MWFSLSRGDNENVRFSEAPASIKSSPGLGLPPVRPWWFIPFIMPFYAIWPMLRRLTNKFGWPGLVGWLMNQETLTEPLSAESLVPVE
jgi:hypothetical protein